MVFSLVAGRIAYESFTPAELPVDREPACGTDDVMILMAQSVPDGDRDPVHQRPPDRVGPSAACA